MRASTAAFSRVQHTGPLAFLVLALLLLNGCGGPEREIERAIDRYDSMTEKGVRVMHRLRNGEITREQAVKKLGPRYSLRVSEQRQRVFRLLREHREQIGQARYNHYVERMSRIDERTRQTLPPG